MNRTALTGLLAAVLAASSSWAATPAQDSVRRLAAILKSSASGLKASNDAPLLSGQLNALIAGLKSLVDEKAATAPAVKPVEDEAAALAAEIHRAPKPLGGEFCRAASDKVLTIAEGAQKLLSGASPAAGAYVPEYSPGFPPPEAAALAAFQKRAAAMAAVMGRTGFDGGPAATPALAPALAPVPLPRPREVARQAKPVYSPQTAAYQGALNPFLKSQHHPALGVDGLAGGSTEKAVAFFQKKKGLPETGVIDRDTETALLNDFQTRRHLPVTGALDAKTAKALRDRRTTAASTVPVYFEGSPSDFEAKDGAKTIKNVLTTVYTPYLAKTKKERKMEGPPIDRHDQTVCTLERYLADACPYVSVAIDPRLNVPNGTPLLIPEISELAGRTIHFRIVDIGSKKRFKGTGHIDVATDSSQNTGFGQLISGGRFTLVLPEGLHPAEL